MKITHPLCALRSSVLLPFLPLFLIMCREGTLAQCLTEHFEECVFWVFPSGRPLCSSTKLERARDDSTAVFLSMLDAQELVCGGIGQVGPLPYLIRGCSLLWTRTLAVVREGSVEELLLTGLPSSLSSGQGRSSVEDHAWPHKQVLRLHLKLH